MNDPHHRALLAARHRANMVEKELGVWQGKVVELRAENAALRAVLRDCLPELDGEGVTIHRVWAALATGDKT